MLDHMLEPSRPVRRLEVITGAGGRRRWSADEKARILEEAIAPGVVVSEVARRHGMSPQHLFTWLRQAKHQTGGIPLTFTPVVVAPEASHSAAAVSRQEAIEIALESAVVRVPAGTDASTLVMVLQALKRVR